MKFKRDKNDFIFHNFLIFKSDSFAQDKSWMPSELLIHFRFSQVIYEQSIYPSIPVHQCKVKLGIKARTSQALSQQHFPNCSYRLFFGFYNLAVDLPICCFCQRNSLIEEALYVGNTEFVFNCLNVYSNYSLYSI